jgi:hypothetical protein
MVGPKGTGKGTMILDAMRAVDAEGAGFCEGLWPPKYVERLISSSPGS